uniref:Uncharacterized protein n=1 Tax=Arundo donax TaxID=35708 RepID=A0A0A9AJG3_ARUDO
MYEEQKKAYQNQIDKSLRTDSLVNIYMIKGPKTESCGARLLHLLRGTMTKQRIPVKPCEWKTGRQQKIL